METDVTDPLFPPDDQGGGEEKDPMEGVEGPGWWALIDGVWRWMTNPLPGSMS